MSAQTGGIATGVAVLVRAFVSADGQSGSNITVSAAAAAGTVAGLLNGNPFKVPKAATSVDVRLLVDHSVVEAYAQGGRAVATLPFCPPSAADDALSVTNNGDTDLAIEMTLSTVATANVIPAA